MSNNVEVDPVNRVVRTPDHFEQPFLRGEESKYAEYASYVADHHIVEIMMGGNNWREYGLRAARIGREIHPSVFLLLEDNLQLGVTHEWNRIGGGGGGGPITRAISTVARGVAEGLPAAMGDDTSGDLMLSPLRLLRATYYSSSNEWTFPLKFTFRMGQYGLWDAETEVWDPLIALLVMCTTINRGDQTLGWPAYETPGPTQFGLLGSLASEALSGAWDAAMEGDPMEGLRTFFGSMTDDAGTVISNASKAVSLIFGINFPEMGQSGQGDPNPDDRSGTRSGLGFVKEDPKEMNYRNLLYFDPCYIESVSVSFGKEKDMKGFPIEGTIDLSVKSVLPAMGNDITGINSKWQRRGPSR